MNKKEEQENTKTYSTNNEYEISEDIISIKLTDKYGKEVGIVLVDLDDADLVLNENWCISGDGYAVTRKAKRMHRVIMNTPKNLVVDHINHKKLDNRKENMRNCTRAENSRNREKQGGVFIRSENGKYQAQIKHNYKCIKLGCYDNYEDAIQARLRAEKKYFGKFAGESHE